MFGRRGISVLMNQWATSFHANRLLLDEVLAGIGEGGLTLAEALQRFGAADAVPGEEADEEATRRRLKSKALAPFALRCAGCRRSRCKCTIARHGASSTSRRGEICGSTRSQNAGSVLHPQPDVRVARRPRQTRPSRDVAASKRRHAASCVSKPVPPVARPTAPQTACVQGKCTADPSPRYGDVPASRAWCANSPLSADS